MNLRIEFIDTIQRIFGERGREWLPRLPSIVAQCRRKWGLHESRICTALSINYIEFATTTTGEAVALKVGVPHAELFTEMAALHLYAGQGAVRLLDTDLNLGAILMQRVQPGTMLWSLGDNDEETRIAAEVMRQIPQPVPADHTFPLFSEWVERAFWLTRTTWDPQERMPRRLIMAAEVAFSEIERTKTTDVVLHGDLHHENIVFDQQAGWLAIDPKGVIGAPCLEVGRFLHNQLPTHLSIAQRQALVRARLRILSSELGYSQEILAASALVDCVLGHCWCFEDATLGPYWHLGIELAESLTRMAGI